MTDKDIAEKKIQKQANDIKDLQRQIVFLRRQLWLAQGKADRNQALARDLNGRLVKVEAQLNRMLLRNG